jgi:hypothetical protein
MTVITEFAYQKHREAFDEHLDQLFFEGYASKLYKEDQLAYDWQLVWYLDEQGFCSEIVDLPSELLTSYPDTI